MESILPEDLLGIRDDISEVDYHADRFAPVPSLSCSIAQRILNFSPAHAAIAHPRITKVPEKEHNPAFDRGTAMHEMLLLGEERIARVKADDWRSKAAKEARQDAVAANMVPLLEHQFESIRVAVECVREQMEEHPDLRGCLALENPREATMHWQEQEHDIWCRARPDLLTPKAIIDFKFSGHSATLEEWGSRAFYNLGYDFRAVYYMRGLQKLAGSTKPYWFVVVEDKPPHALALFECTDEVVANAMPAVEEAMNLWGRCMRDNVWPGYPTNRQWIDLPTHRKYRSEAVTARARFEGHQMIENAARGGPPELVW